MENTANTKVLTPDNVESFAGLTIVNRKTPTAICVGLYGTGGSGKTSVLAQIVLSPHGTPALLVDVEGGSTSVEHLIEHGLDIVKPKSWGDIQKIREMVKRGNHKYKSIIWDNVSEIVNLCMRNVTTLEIPQIQHYGQVNSRMQEFIREQRDLARLEGLNTLLVFWEEYEKDELMLMTRKKLNLSPKLGAAIPGIVTMMGRLTVAGSAKSNYVRKLSFAPSEDTDAKFRVRPDEEAAKIPLELYLKRDSTFLPDFLATIRDGKPFPVENYQKPKSKEDSDGR